ncbi:hypothetical protein KAK07_11270 [Ideonella sp. 4Y16]|uniref:TPM domain-containing protein n=1 Tax=Ideonella alba TaxID=2824118 RepID=A0A941BHH2_9BURK|nr:hypothetical protein [Ideonella alba]MBQ0931608.1 hypothetical protein [Ideonella alba]MBQ0943914.1 hypothetical protein [Ideonella alba]
MIRRQLLAVALAAPCAAIGAAEALSNIDVLLLQPEAQLRERVDGDALSRHVLALQDAARHALEAQFARRPNAGFLVVGLRPGHAPRAWLDLDQPLPDAAAQALRGALEGVKPPAVRGTVIVALKASLWGGRVSPRKAPVPAQWRAAAARSADKLEIDQLADMAWSDE